MIKIPHELFGLMLFQWVRIPIDKDHDLRLRIAGVTDLEFSFKAILRKRGAGKLHAQFSFDVKTHADCCRTLQSFVNDILERGRLDLEAPTPIAALR